MGSCETWAKKIDIFESRRVFKNISIFESLHMVGESDFMVEENRCLHVT